MIPAAAMTYVNLVMALFSSDLPNEPRAEALLKQVGTELKCGHNYDFDYAKLSVLWVPGYCLVADRHCLQELNREQFMIEEMKPISNDGIHPVYCCMNKDFNYNEFNAVQAGEVEQLWHSLHENWADAQVVSQWVKHGTCARKMNDYIKNQLTYIGNALRVFKRLELERFMRSKKYLDSSRGNGDQINGQQLVDSLRELTQGKLARIQCKIDDEFPGATQGTPVFTGLEFCYDKKYNYVDCEKQADNCLGQLQIINNPVIL